MIELQEDWGDVDRRDWPGGPLVMIRDESVVGAMEPHDFDHVMLTCKRCARGYHEVENGDGDPGCVPAKLVSVDYLSITRYMVAGA